jgi:hypothetical protein
LPVQVPGVSQEVARQPNQSPLLQAILQKSGHSLEEKSPEIDKRIALVIAEVDVDPFLFIRFTCTRVAQK